MSAAGPIDLATAKLDRSPSMKARVSSQLLADGLAEAVGPRIKPAVNLLRADQVEIRPTDWVWQNWLARGCLHLIAGSPGTGKSTIAIELGSIITRGGRFPDGAVARSASVVYWTGEDSVPMTLAPRAIAAGADLEKLHFVMGVAEGDGERAFNPAVDIDLLAQALDDRSDIAVLIIDPLISVVTGDSHKNGEVRSGLAPLVELAERRGIAVLGVHHFSKGTAGRDPLERATGSIAFGAVVRVAWAAAKDANDETGDQRRLVRMKSNLGPDGGGFAYKIEPFEIASESGAVGTSKIAWGEALEGSAKDLLGEPDNAGAIPRNDAEDFLRDRLSTGPVLSKEITERATQHGISRRTLERAKADLGVQSVKAEFAGGWLWKLPEGRHTLPKAATQNSGDLRDLGGGLRLEAVE